MNLVEPPRVGLSRLFRASPVAGALSVLGNLLVYAAARVMGASLQVPEGPGSTALLPLGAPQVVLASLMPAFAAAIVLALLGRLVRDPFRIFRLIASVLLLASVVPVLLLPSELGTKLALLMMHGVGAAAIVFTLDRFGREPA